MRQRKTSTTPSGSNNGAKQQKLAAPKDIDRLVNSSLGSLVFLIALPFAVQISNAEVLDLNKIFKNVYTFTPETSMLSVLIEEKFDFFKRLFPLPNAISFQIVLSYYFIQILLHVIIPGETFLGYPISFDGSRLPYKVNGLRCFIITIALFLTAVYHNLFDPSVVVDNWLQIAVANNIVAYALSTFMYLKGWIFKQGNPCGSFLMDFFYGYEPNPRIFGWKETDIKWFLEGRVLIWWNLLIFCVAYKQYVLLGTLTRGMVLIVAVQTLYIAHYFVHEVLVLNMIDFLADNMGWMLGWGNLVWVSMVYSLPAMHALHNPQEMNVITAAILLGIAILGYVIFAQSNIQKFQFRDDPKKSIWGKLPTVVPTKSGKGLLASGWWGVIRKPNYTGDLIIAYSYGLPSFTIGVAPYIIAIFLTVLLLNRAKRDDGWCKAKYGDDWDKYCKVVPYMLIPYIF